MFKRGGGTVSKKAKFCSIYQNRDKKSIKENITVESLVSNAFYFSSNGLAVPK